MGLRHEPLVDELVDSEERIEVEVGRKTDLSWVVHDENCIALAGLERPLCFDGRAGDTKGVPVAHVHAHAHPAFTRQANTRRQKTVTHAAWFVFSSRRFAPCEAMIRSLSTGPSWGGKLAKWILTSCLHSSRMNSGS